MNNKRIYLKMKKATILLLFSVFVSLILSPTFVFAADKNADNRISFIWAFGAIKNDSGSVELVNIDRDITLKKGDQIKMLVQLKSNCFVYVIHLGSKGEINLLYPEIPGQFNLDEKVYIPQDDYWFTLDEDKGKEIFYLLASKTVLTSLEDLFKRVKATDQNDKRDLADQIITEIRKIKKQNKKSLRASAERPVSMGGSFRGVEKKKSDHLITRHSIKITAKDFYSKTFNIEHE